MGTLVITHPHVYERAQFTTIPSCAASTVTQEELDGVCDNLDKGVT